MDNNVQLTLLNDTTVAPVTNVKRKKATKENKARWINSEKIPTIVKNGAFFTIAFTKKDGTIRILNGRMGVSKYVNGKGGSWDPATKNMIIVWDTDKSNRSDEKDLGYRCVALDRVIFIRANGNLYYVNHE